MSIAISPAPTDHPRDRRRALVELFAQLSPAPLPPGTWLLSAPDSPEQQLEVLVDSDGPRRLTVLNTPVMLRAWTKAALVSAAWLFEATRDGGVARFAWSDVARIFGHRRAPAGTIDALRRALDELTAPALRATIVDLRPSDGDPGWAVEQAGSYFRALSLQRRGHHGPRAKPSAVTLDPLLSAAAAAGAYSSVPAADLLGVDSDVDRRLWLLATALTLRPIDADGLIRAPLEIAAAARAVGLTDRRADRALARLTMAVEDLGRRDARFAGSGLRDGHVVLLRSAPLLPPAAFPIRQ